MKALIFGCGGAGQNHCNQLKGRLDYDVYDIDSQKAEKTAKQHGVKVGNPEDKYDIVVICVPAVYHYESVMKFIDKSIVCVEKPMTLKPVDAQYLLKYDNLYVLESMMYSEPVLKAKEMMNSLGGPLLWRANYCTKYRPQSWIKDIEIGGQTFLEGGVHIVSVANFLFGQGICHTGFFINDDRTNGVINIKYINGDILNLSICWGVESCLSLKKDVIPNDNYLIGNNDYMHFAPFDDHKRMWDYVLDDINGVSKTYFTNQMAADAVSDVWKCYNFLDKYKGD